MPIPRINNLFLPYKFSYEKKVFIYSKKKVGKENNPSFSAKYFFFVTEMNLNLKIQINRLYGRCVYLMLHSTLNALDHDIWWPYWISTNFRLHKSLSPNNHSFYIWCINMPGLNNKVSTEKIRKNGYKLHKLFGNWMGCAHKHWIKWRK